MPYLDGFQNDIFINYSHIDDQPLTEGQKGWISSFHNSLQVRLGQLLGSELTIWRDPRLTGNTEFEPVIFKQFLSTGILISVLSPRYLNSSWCLDEVKAFAHAADESGGRFVENRSRFFKVVKTHVPRESHPSELQWILGYEFYRIDGTTGRPVEFLLDPSPDAVRNYWAKLEDLAYDIHDMLKALRAGHNVLMLWPICNHLLPVGNFLCRHSWILRIQKYGICN